MAVFESEAVHNFLVPELVESDRARRYLPGPDQETAEADRRDEGLELDESAQLREAQEEQGEFAGRVREEQEGRATRTGLPEEKAQGEFRTDHRRESNQFEHRIHPVLHLSADDVFDPGQPVLVPLLPDLAPPPRAQLQHPAHARPVPQVDRALNPLLHDRGIRQPWHLLPRGVHTHQRVVEARGLGAAVRGIQRVLKDRRQFTDHQGQRVSVDWRLHSEKVYAEHRRVL